MNHAPRSDRDRWLISNHSAAGWRGARPRWNGRRPLLTPRSATSAVVQCAPRIQSAKTALRRCAQNARSETVTKRVKGPPGIHQATVHHRGRGARWRLCHHFELPTAPSRPFVESLFMRQARYLGAMPWQKRLGQAPVKMWIRGFPAHSGITSMISKTTGWQALQRASIAAASHPHSLVLGQPHVAGIALWPADISPFLSRPGSAP